MEARRRNAETLGLLRSLEALPTQMDPETHGLLSLSLGPGALKQTVLATTPHKAPGLDGLPYDVLRLCSDSYYENLSDSL